MENARFSLGIGHTYHMVKKRRFVLMASVLVGFVWLALRSREPSYQGKSLSSWMQGYGYNHDMPQHQKADEAVRQLGTNAVPTLLQMLRAKDSALTIKLRKLARKQTILKIDYHMAEFDNNHACEGFKALGSVASNAVPPLIEIYEMNISEESQFDTAEALAYLGPAATAAVPSLINGARTNPSIRVRFRSVMTLGAIHTQPETVIPVLMDLLKDREVDVRWRAAEALGSYGTNARPAVATLFGLLNDRESALRDAAENALKKIDPSAFIARLTEALSDPAADVRANAAATLQSEGFGAQVRLSVPALIRTLRDPDESVRQNASEALKKIDPEAATKAGVQ